MPRGLPSGYLAEVEKDHGDAATVRLIELTYWDGSSEQELYLTDASQDIDATVDGSPQTFTGTGGLLDYPGMRESEDTKEQGVDLTLSGVDQTTVAIILSNQFRGRLVRIWEAKYDVASGTIVDSPQLQFEGFQNDPYEMEEEPGEDGQPGTARITTRVVSRLGSGEARRVVKTNLTSHQEMLERAGLTADDTFFQNVPAITNREVYWGRDAPDRATSSGGAGARGEGGSHPGQKDN